MAIWLPLQILAIAFVTVLAYLVLRTPRSAVTLHSYQLLYVGIVLLQYYIFIVLKDFVIMVS